MNPFHDFITDDERLKVINHEGAGLITGIVSLLDGKARVSLVTPRIIHVGENAFSVTITTDFGINLFRISMPDLNDINTDFTYYIERRGDNPSGKTWNDMISSKNWRYLLKQLAENRSGQPRPKRRRKTSVANIGDSISDYYTRSLSYHRDYLNNSVRRLVEAAMAGKRLNVAPANSEVTKYLIDVYNNPDQRHSLPADDTIRNFLMQLTTESKRVDEARVQFAERVDTAINSPKYVVIAHPSGFVSVGTFDASKYNYMANMHIQGGQFIEELSPFRLYKSLDTVDPAFKDKLMARLTMDKMFIKNKAGRRSGFFADEVPDTEGRETWEKIDPLNLIPTDDHTDAEIGYTSFTTVYRNATYMHVVLDM